MKYRTFIPFLLSLIFILSGNAANSGTSDMAQALRSKVVDAPDSVLAELDKLEKRKHPALPSYQINLLRGLAYNEKKMYSMMERYAKRALDSDSISAHPKDKLSALIVLSQAQAFFGNYQASIESSIEAIEIARQEGNKGSEYNILATMAQTAFKMGDTERGYGYLERILKEGSNSTDVRVLANVSSAYGIKIIQLYADGRFAEGLSEGRKRLALIDKIDRVGGSPEGFTDQQRAYAYARIASCVQQLGKTDEAHEAYNDFMATDYAQNPIGKSYIMDYLLDSGQWNTVLEFTAPLYSMFQDVDTINVDYHSLLAADGRALAGLGKFREGYGLIQRAAVIQDSLYLREKSTRAQELASIFELNEKELALANEKATSQRKHILMITSTGIAILILIILILVWRAYRISVKQQAMATKRIDELIARQPLEAEATPENQKDYTLFAALQSKLISEALFKSPDLNRDGIAEATGLSRAKVSQLIGQFTNLSPSEYIHKLRVEYSAKMIQEHPEWTIDAIAEHSGYVRRATYYHHFNKFFGITPSQYRKGKIKAEQPPHPQPATRSPAPKT